MGNDRFTRRDFLKSAGMITGMAAFGQVPAELLAALDEQKLVRYPEKTDMILVTSRPPQLETPFPYFKELITPNEAVFVRWHIANVPTSVDLDTWRLTIGGNTEKELQLSMNELRTKFAPVRYTAVIQCSGNSRSLFEPRVAGGQWKNGAMGNVTWTGARLKDILNAAGLKEGSVDVAFDGLDGPPLPSVPDFVKSLPVDKALDEDIIVAYEMNGKALPMLNGFPARLIVPGWFATYWVKSLSSITVLNKQFDGFWVKTAYRIPDNPCGCVPPGGKPDRTIPINRMTTRSFIVDPSDGSTLKANKPITMMGIAFSGGYGIRDVLVSLDGGRSWDETQIGKDMGKYAWVQWSYPWKPKKAGKYTLMVRATNSIGESQPVEKLWNPAGYLKNDIEKVEVVVR
ncbi:MAG TPA: molybdopterin-dependent oxidoreductase [Nitrospirota bacterium]|nr:molybdopterin-dependent oxidoreductase [Nitrospirota bacterium]